MSISTVRLGLVAACLAPLLTACSDSPATNDMSMDLSSGPDLSSADLTPPPDLYPPQVALPALPLKTQGRFILDANGHRFKLAGSSWYGADEKDFVVGGLDKQPLIVIAKQMHDMGFNSVRLPWSNQMVESNPLIADSALSANPQLKGMHALDVFDAVVGALAHEGLVVILDNHVSVADWCCQPNDQNALWYTTAYPETMWLADWKMMATRYLNQPAVVGADLRNEPRPPAVWGGSDPTVDWQAAAKRGGDAVLSVNPNLLIIVEGVFLALDLTAIGGAPVVLSTPNRLVYSAHDYPFDYPGGVQSYASYKTAVDMAWGYLLTQTNPVPVWLGEFGTNHATAGFDSMMPGTNGLWFNSARKYLTDNDIDWNYWPLNGTQSTGAGRTLGAEESFGILNTMWSAAANPMMVSDLQAIVPHTLGP